MLEWWGRGRGLPGSPAPPCRRQHRASAPPKGQSHLIRPNLQAGARSEVKSLQLSELATRNPAEPMGQLTTTESHHEYMGAPPLPIAVRL